MEYNLLQYNNDIYCKKYRFVLAGGGRCVNGMCVSLAVTKCVSLAVTKCVSMVSMHKVCCLHGGVHMCCMFW